jgi:hypothetical protein
MLNDTRIRPVGAELFNVGRRRDIMKLIITFHKVANALKNLADAFSDVDEILSFAY